MPDLKGKASLDESRNPVLSRRGAGIAPLSFAQERLWLIDAAAPGSVTYNVPLLSRWHEPVDSSALGVALDALVARHDVLRTSYHLRDGSPVQVVADQGAVPIEVVDVDGDRDVWERVREDAAKRAREPFDLAEGPVARCVVWRGAPGADAVLLCVHHIAIDGWSLASLYEDLELAYEAALAGSDPQWAELPVRYTDFAAWDRETFDDPASRRLLADRLADLAEVRGGLPLAGARPRPALPEGDRPGRDHVLALPDQVWSGVGGLARTLRATPFVVLLAAYQATLLRWSGRAEFLVGTVTVNRPRPELERLVGFFVNTVPLRCQVSPEWTFGRLCRTVRTEAFRSLTYQRIPFDQLTAAASRNGVRDGLVDVGFALQNFPAPRHGSAPRWSPPEVLPTGTAKFDLLLTVEEREDGAVAVLEYDTSRYPAEVAERIGATFVEILADGVAGADRELGSLGHAGPDPELLSTVDENAGRAAPPSRRVPDADLKRELRLAAELFAGVLSEGNHDVTADRFGADADFFTSGGHSLLVVRMLAEAQRRHGVTVSPRDFLAEPTVSGLAGLLAVATTATPAAAEVVPDESHPATSVQQRFWFLDRIPALREAYLVPTVLEYTGEVDRDVLRRAVELVLARHPALRSRFRLDRKLRAVCYRTDGPAPVVTSTEASGQTDEDLRAHLAEACWEPFDLATDAPARAEIVTPAGRTLLVLVVHHIVADGWSRELIVEQVAEAYRAEVARRKPDLPEPVHPAALTEPSSVAEDRVTAVVDRLRGAPTDVWLPHDRARPEVQATVATTRTVTLDADLAGRLRTVAGELGCTTFMVTAALLATTLAGRCDQRDFLFAFPWAGRDTPGSEHAVGMFVNTLVLRVDLTGAPTWRELLARVREHSMFCYRNADVAFDAVAGALHPERDLSRPPLTPVYLSAQDGHPNPPSPHQGVATRYLPLDPLLIKYELELVVTEHAGELELAASYAVDLFDDHAIADLLDAMVARAVDLAADPDAHPVEGI